MKIDEESLAVLSGSIDYIGIDRVVITEQLDRKDYTRVNKVLEALGGKWTKKVKAHVFPGDPRVVIEAAMLTGEVTTAADLGFFQTPPALAAELAEACGIGRESVVLEPSAGLGRLVDAALNRQAAKVIAVEYDTGRRTKLKAGYGGEINDRVYVATEPDFMNYRRGQVRIDRVLMNPAFCKVGIGDHIDHVQHAFAMLDRGVLVSVLPHSVDFRQDRRHTAFRAWIAANDGVLTTLPDGSFKESGTGVRTTKLWMAKG